MKFSIVDENLSVDFGFIYDGQLIKLNVYGAPIDVILFEKMLKSVGFEKEDKHDS